MKFSLGGDDNDAAQSANPKLIDAMEPGTRNELIKRRKIFHSFVTF